MLDFAVKLFFRSDCIDIVSRQCAFSHVFQFVISYQSSFHNGCIGMVSRQCVLFHVLQDQIYGQSSCHNGCIGVASHQCVFLMLNKIRSPRFLNPQKTTIIQIYFYFCCIIRTSIETKTQMAKYIEPDYTSCKPLINTHMK